MQQKRPGQTSCSSSRPGSHQSAPQIHTKRPFQRFCRAALKIRTKPLLLCKPYKRTTQNTRNNKVYKTFKREVGELKSTGKSLGQHLSIKSFLNTYPWPKARKKRGKIPLRGCTSRPGPWYLVPFRSEPYCRPDFQACCYSIAPFFRKVGFQPTRSSNNTKSFRCLTSSILRGILSSILRGI